MTKYHAIKTPCSLGHMHDSKLESRRCEELHGLQELGRLSRLELQPEFRVEINGRLVCRYVADFAWFTADCRVIEDVKGVATPVFRLKKKLVEAAHPGVVITVWPPKVRNPRKRKAA